MADNYAPAKVFGLFIFAFVILNRENLFTVASQTSHACVSLPQQDLRRMS
jgi:hypothetical protein